LHRLEDSILIEVLDYLLSAGTRNNHSRKTTRSEKPQHPKALPQPIRTFSPNFAKKQALVDGFERHNPVEIGKTSRIAEVLSASRATQTSQRHDAGIDSWMSETSRRIGASANSR
jgi:hypothetical protein